MSDKCRLEAISAPASALADSGILEAVPLFAGRPPGYWRCEALGGITNRTYHVGDSVEATEAYALRVTARGTRYLDRAAEAHNARIAGEIGITPPVLYTDDQAFVTRFLTGARPLAVAEFGDRQRLDQVAGVLRRLQHAPRRFMGERHPFREIDKYLTLYADPQSLALRGQAQPIAEAIARRDSALVPAHVDPNASNFLLCSDGSLQLVDWEFSAMADPCWDVAAVLSQTAVDAAAARGFVAATLGRADDAVLARVELFRAAMFLVAGSWCAMEAAFRGDAELRRMADRYLDHCAAALADARMPHWLSGLCSPA